MLAPEIGPANSASSAMTAPTITPPMVTVSSAGPNGTEIRLYVRIYVRDLQSQEGQDMADDLADAVTEAIGTRVAPYGALVLAGFRGQETEGTKLIDATIEEATAGGQGTAVQYAYWARAVLMNGLGRYEEALAAAVDRYRAFKRPA